MPLEDWIHRYPKVQELLQGEEELLYGVEDADEEPEPTTVIGYQAYTITVPPYDGWTPGEASTREELARLAAHLEHIRDKSLDETYRRELRELMADIVQELGSSGDANPD